MKTLHEYKVKNIKGEEVPLKQYEGKVVMVVNTATGCGFTHQLDALEQLYRDYKEEGFEVLAFPSNDFADQEPLEGEAIQEFCELNFNTTFPIFEKSQVTGKNQSPIFEYLSNKKLNGKFNSIPKWNFHKFLVDKKGQVVDYFYTFTSPTSSKVKKAVEKLLDS